MTFATNRVPSAEPKVVIQFAGGSAWTPGVSRHGLVATTLIGDVEPAAQEPLRPTDWNDVETLLDRHVERMDNVYRRLG